MAEGVEHMATVTALHHGSISVEISTGQNCRGCGIAAMCGSKGERFEMELKVDDATSFSVGERVVLIANGRSTWRAICVGIVLPCVLLCCSVIGLLAIGAGQLAAACAGIAVAALYYAVLYIFRNKLVDRLSWTIEKTVSR